MTPDPPRIPRLLSSGRSTDVMLWWPSEAFVYFLSAKILLLSSHQYLDKLNVDDFSEGIFFILLHGFFVVKKYQKPIFACFSPVSFSVIQLMYQNLNLQFFTMCLNSDSLSTILLTLPSSVSESSMDSGSSGGWGGNCCWSVDFSTIGWRFIGGRSFPSDDESSGGNSLGVDSSNNFNGSKLSGVSSS